LTLSIGGRRSLGRFVASIYILYYGEKGTNNTNNRSKRWTEMDCLVGCIGTTCIGNEYENRRRNSKDSSEFGQFMEMMIVVMKYWCSHCRNKDN